tara:strand:+ start:72 stop:812 length:741 start_codon:yes stop_codon:yes gene_type:complete
MSYLIVGASSGLGRELAYVFAENKKNLCLISRDERDLNTIKSDLKEKFFNEVEVLNLDFSKENEIKDKLLSNKNLIEKLEGVLFPIGLMFDHDDIHLSSESVNKLNSANYLSVCLTISELIKIKKDKEFLIVGFGSVSGLLGRNINSYYAAAKRALETYFESLIFNNKKNNFNIHFYTLGYLNTGLAFGKDLKLPKGEVKKLARTVFKNKNKKIIMKYFPSFWKIISLSLRLLPLGVLLKFKSFTK